jgi:uncharacterized surface protein with fasciclin (FAS1) repeats
MIVMRKVITPLALALFGVTSIAGAQQDPAPPMNIVQTAQAAGSFKTLVQAVEAAGLAGTLAGKGPFTVFAPTDDAFAKLPAGTLESLLQPQNREKLRAILLYHVVPGDVKSSVAAHLPSARTEEGARVKFTASGGKVMVNNATVIHADIQASNGVIHVIDTVLMPPNS